MIARCPSCNVLCKVDDSRVTLKGIKIRCPKCQFIFTVRKPEESSVPPEQIVQQEQQAKSAIEREQEQSQFYQERRRKRILIAEDTVFFQKMLYDLLTNEGYEVLLASDGEEALQMLKHELPDLDLLVLDLQLPKISGFELLSRIRKAKLSQNLPVLVMTGVHKKAEEVMLVRKLGASGYISKSNPPDHFVFRIKQILYPED